MVNIEAATRWATMINEHIFMFDHANCMLTVILWTRLFKKQNKSFKKIIYFFLTSLKKVSFFFKSNFTL